MRESSINKSSKNIDWGEAGYSLRCRHLKEDFCTLPPSRERTSLFGANANQLACRASDCPECEAFATKQKTETQGLGSGKIEWGRGSGSWVLLRGMTYRWAFRFGFRSAERAALRKIPREPTSSLSLCACGMRHSVRFAPLLPSASRQTKTPTKLVGVFVWWGKLDSDQRSQ